ncbi:MAG: DUF1579 family protein [Chthoniobacterales bacterium]
MKTLSVSVLLATATVAITLAAAQAPPPGELKDPFLDNFVGEWRIERKMGNGKTTESSVRGEWALNHHWIRLDYGYADKPAQYEAVVFIGYDDAAKRYICHWMDVYGASESALGGGELDAAKHAIELNFDSKEASLRNTFSFDQDKSWTSLIRQTEKGEWKTFAEEKWTRLKK